MEIDVVPNISTILKHQFQRSSCVKFFSKKSLTSFGMNSLFYRPYISSVLSSHAIQPRMPSPPISRPASTTRGVTALASRRFCDRRSFNRKYLSLLLYNTRVSSVSLCVNVFPREHPRPPRACLRLHQNSRYATKILSETRDRTNALYHNNTCIITLKLKKIDIVNI